jgi:predicted nucleic acid-binding protein
MARVALASASPEANSIYYLDTSVLFALAVAAYHTATGATVRADELARAAEARSFLSQVSASGGHIRTSTLAFQEIAHATRKRARNVHAKAAGFGDWHDLLKKKGPRSIVRDAAHADTLRFLSHAVRAMRGVRCEVELQTVPQAETVAFGRNQRAAHRSLLRKHPELDPMDALHIVVGYGLGARHFLSFDEGWETVAGISVYG